MAERLSERQDEILDFICTFSDEHGYPPTYEEICTEVGLSTKSLAKYHLRALERKGHIACAPRTPRGIRILRRQGGTFKVPFLGQIAAGQPISFADDPHEAIELTADIVRQQEGLFALRVKGDSMVDALVHDGDIVVMKHQQEAEPGEMVAVRLRDKDETTLKRFYSEGNRVRLQPANPAFQPLYARPSNVEIQGKVVAVIRQIA